MKNVWLTGGILVLFSTCTWAESIYDQPYLGKLGRPWDRFSARSLEAQAREGLGGMVAAADLIILGTAQGLRELRSGQPPDPDKIEAQKATVRAVRVLKGKTDQKEFKLRWTPSATSIRDGARHVFFLKLRKGADPLVQKAMYLYPKRSNVMRIVGMYGCSEDVGLAVLDHLIQGSRPVGLPKKLLAEYQSSSYEKMYSAAVMAASAKIEIGQDVLKRVIAERRRKRFDFDLFCTAAHALAAKKRDEGLKFLLVNIPVPPGYGRMAESVVFDLVAVHGTTKLVPRLVKFARENPRYGVSAAFALAGIGGDQARRGIEALLADPGVSKRTEVVRGLGTRKVPAADLLRQALSACRADYSKQVAQSGWVWSDEEATPLYCLTQAGQKYDVHLVNPHDKRWALIIRIFNGKRKVHEWLGHHNSVFRILRDRLYYARFNRGSSGGTIVAVDLKTGKHLWSSPLKALGPVRHSSYRNLMNLSVSDKVVVVSGKESFGNYLEYKDVKTGKTLGHKRFTRAPAKAVGATPKKEAQKIPVGLRTALRGAGTGNLAARRRAATDLCIALLKKNGAWRKDPLNWKILTEEDIRLEVAGVAKSDQTEEHAIENLCAHCMGMLEPGRWSKQPLDERNPLEEAVASLAKKSTDPAVRTILLVGLASSPRTRARDTVVAATSDPHAGVRKSACYLVERGTSRDFGPGGNIHGGSTRKSVEIAGKGIRAVYRWDRTVGAGWGRMRGGLQTRLVVKPKVAVVGQPVKVSLIVRNVYDHRVSLPNKTHPVRHFNVWRNKKRAPIMGDIPGPLPSVTLDPGKQVEYLTFVVNDRFKMLEPGTYRLSLAPTFGELPPHSNRVDIKLEPRKNAPKPRSDSPPP